LSAVLLLVALGGCKYRESQVLPGLSSDNPVLVDDALIMAQAEFSSPKVVAIAEKKLDDDDPKIRYDAALALGNFQSPSSVDALAKHVDDPDPKVARAAVTVLGKMKAKAAAPAIVAVLAAHPTDPPLDDIWALGQCRSPEGRPILETLRHSTDPWVAYNATVALRTVDSP
jgi:HEAT repeat protein